MKTAIAEINALETTSNKMNNQQPPVHLTFSQSWLDKRKLKAKNLKIMPVNNDDLAPELNRWDFVTIDTANTSIVNGRFHAFTYDNQFYIKRLKTLPNGDLESFCNMGRQVIKKCNAKLFIPLGLVVYKQGDL